MQKYIVDWLVCPACHGDLSWSIDHATPERIVEATAHCSTCDAAYNVRDEIGIFLTPDLPRNDLWEQAESGLTRYLREHPDLEQRLMHAPLDTLNPADQFFRMMLLEERGDYAAAWAIKEHALPRLYTEAYITGWQRQIAYVVERVTANPGPVVDLACGRGYLVEKLIAHGQNPIIATDFSPVVLRRNRAAWQSLGLYDRISLLAFDARRTPFKTDSVATITTNLGLPNIEQPGALLDELHRVVSGEFLVISHFFPPEDSANAAVIREQGLETFLYENKTRAQFRATGWTVELVNGFSGPAKPTPEGEIIPARIDGLPTADTTLQWYTVIARSDDTT